MHFLCEPKRFVGLGYRHRDPICPIIQHILIPNINKVIHKLIGWWGEDEFPNTQGAHIKDPSKKNYIVEESVQN
jgi:hypothetical protein